MVEKESEGRAARGSWCMMKRMEGRSFMLVEGSLAGPWAGALEGMAGVVGTGPEWFLTVSCGAAVSARVRVIATRAAGGGEGAGGEGEREGERERESESEGKGEGEGEGGCGCESGSGAVWERKGLGRVLVEGSEAAGGVNDGSTGGAATVEEGRRVSVCVCFVEGAGEGVWRCPSGEQALSG